MQIRPGSTTGVTHKGNDLPFANFVADSNEIFRIMRVARGIAIAVIDFNKLAKAVPW